MEITPKEAKEVLERIKDEQASGKGEMRPTNFDGLEVRDPKTDKEYRWANMKSANVDRKNTQGWEICKDPSVKAGFFRDGTHKNGDLILMEMPKELAEKRRKEIEDRGRSYERIAQQDFHEMGKRMNVETFEHIRKERR